MQKFVSKFIIYEKNFFIFSCCFIDFRTFWQNYLNILIDFENISKVLPQLNYLMLVDNLKRKKVRLQYVLTF